MKKDIVFLTCVKNPNHHEKFGGYEWMEYSKKTWGFWCNKNNCKLFIYEIPYEKDLLNIGLHGKDGLMCLNN